MLRSEKRRTFSGAGRTCANLRHRPLDAWQLQEVGGLAQSPDLSVRPPRAPPQSARACGTGVDSALAADSSAIRLAAFLEAIAALVALARAAAHDRRDGIGWHFCGGGAAAAAVGTGRWSADYGRLRALWPPPPPPTQARPQLQRGGWRRGAIG